MLASVRKRADQGRDGQDHEGGQQEVASGRLPPPDEAHVVDEHHEARKKSRPKNGDEDSGEGDDRDCSRERRRGWR